MSVKVYPISLGCPKNRVDTERTLGRPELRVRLAARPRGADVVFINTCGFIDPAVRESVQVILQMSEEIAALPEGKRPLLAVAGCLVGRYGQAGLAHELPEVDLWLPTAELESWPDLLREALQGAGRWQEPKRPRRLPGAGRLLSTGSYAWLKVSEGCGQSCSFCTIPQIRGRLRSQGPDFLEREARDLLGRGVRELILVAQNLTSWGRDLQDPSSLEKLVERLLPLPGLARLRLMYLYPAGLSEELLSFLREAAQGERALLPYFDIPLQHADAAVLKSMGRPFAGDPFKVVERIRKYFPQAALRTSLITGFPGEDEAAFARLCEFVRAARFQNLGVFAYQAEDGTLAAAMPGQVPVELREERRGVIMEMQAEISRELLEPYMGQDVELVIDAPHPEWPGLYVGRTWFQAPEVDGVTYVSGEGLEVGQLVTATVNETFDYDLSALV